MALNEFSHQRRLTDTRLKRKLFSAGMIFMLLLSAILPVAPLPLLSVEVAQAQTTVALAPPTFNLTRGYYEDPISVSLSHLNPAAKIHYTLDGSTPQTIAGGRTIAYTGPININSTVAIRAIAFTTAADKSVVVTHTYLYVDQVRNQSNDPNAQYAYSPPRTGAYAWPNIFACNTDGWAVDKMGMPLVPAVGMVDCATSNPPGSGYPADYEMDPDIIGYHDQSGQIPLEQALLDLPTMSLVTDMPYLWDETNGIYFNPNNKSGDPDSPVDNWGLGQGFDAWERPVSIEWFAPGQWFTDTQTTPASVGEIAGARMHGQASRRPKNTPKHTFRLSFKKKYGAGKLDFSLFDFGDPAAKFDHILLRNGGNRIWNYHDRDQRGEADYINDEWSRRVWIQMGHLGARGTYAHLYVNGLYWGVYNITERLADNFFQAYLGGLETDYDYIVAEEESGDVPVASTGDLTTYRTIVELLGGERLPVSADADAAEAAGLDSLYPLVPITLQNSSEPVTTAVFNQVAELMDMENFADYMLHTHYIGKTDWPNHNWNAYRSRRPNTDQRLKWITWDNDSGMNNRNRLYDAPNDAIDYWASPSWMWLRLMSNAEFRQLYMDRIQKHIVQSDGALTPANCAAVYGELKTVLDPAIIGESARWGDYSRDVYARPDATPNKGLPAYLYSYNLPADHALNFTVTWPISSPYYISATLNGGNPHGSDMKNWLDVVDAKLATGSSGYCLNRAGLFLQQYQSGGIRIRGATSTPTDTLPILVWTDTVKAPVFSQLGGGVPNGFSLAISNPDTGGAGEVYYTTDGTDPRAQGGGVAGTAVLAPGSGNDSATVPITSVMKVQARVKNGSEWSPLVSYMFYPPQPFDNLIINEIHYNPWTPPLIDGDDFEFIELYNKGDVPLRLDDVTFTRGISFRFPYNTVMAPGEYIVLASDMAGFAHPTYGHPGVTPFGDYRGNLSNNGEVIELRDGTTKFDGSGGVLIASVDVDDDHNVDPGWPLTPDGTGPSLELTDWTKANEPKYDATGKTILHEQNPRYQGANWHASSIDKGTPGRANTTPPTVSITAPGPGAEFVKGSPINITADAADVGGTVTQVAFFATKDGVETPIASCVDTTAPYACTWTPAVSGLYALTAKATDNEQGTTTSIAVNITVLDPANLPPSVAIANPSTGADFNVGSTVPIQAVASDTDGTVAGVSFAANGLPIAGCANLTAPFICSWVPAAAGSYLLTATAVDNSGGSKISEIVTVSVNAVGSKPPTVAITSPANGTTFQLGSPVTIAANASDTDGTVLLVTFYVNGQEIPGCADATAPYECTWTPAASGIHSLTARATDNSGATTNSIIVAISVNDPGNLPPGVSITTPSNGATVQTNQQVIIAAEATDNDGNVAKVTFYANGVAISGCEDSAAPFTCAWQPVSAGIYNLTAVAQDNVGGVTISPVVTVESISSVNQPPVVAITSPLGGASFAVGTAVTIQAEASDPDGTVTQVTFFADGLPISDCVDTSAPYSCSWTPTTPGAYNLVAQAQDNEGISTSSAPVSVTVNADGNTPPTVSITSPTGGSNFAIGTAVTIAATAADSDGSVAQVAFFVDGEPIAGCVDTTAPYECSWTPGAPAGVKNLTARATDNGGATTISTVVAVTANASGTAPTVSILAPANNSRVQVGKPVEITVDAVSASGELAADAITEVRFYANGTLIPGCVDTAAPYQCSWIPAEVGSYNLTAQATDNLGNVGIALAVTVIAQTEPVTNQQMLFLPVVQR